MARQFSKDKGIWIPAGGGLIQPKGVDVLLEQGVSVEEWVQTHQGEYDSLETQVTNVTNNVNDLETQVTDMEDDVEALTGPASFIIESVTSINYRRNAGFPFLPGDAPTGTCDFPEERLLQWETFKLYTWSGGAWDSGRAVEEGEKFLFWQDGSNENNNGDNGSTYKIYTFTGSGWAEEDPVGNREYYIIDKEVSYFFYDNWDFVPFLQRFGGFSREIQFFQNGGFNYAPGVFDVLDQYGIFEDVHAGVPDGFVGYYVGGIAQINKVLEPVNSPPFGDIESWLSMDITKNGENTGGGRLATFRSGVGNVLETEFANPGYDWGFVFYPDDTIGVRYAFGTPVFAPTDIILRCSIRLLYVPDKGMHGTYNFAP